MVKFDKCCRSVELRTGCLIIGYINLVALVVLFVMGFIDDEKIKAEAVLNDDTDLFFIGYVVTLLIYFAFNITLLVGIHKNKPVLVKIYLVAAVIVMVLFIVEILSSVISQGTIRFSHVLDLINFGISIYFVLIIRSQYLKMKEENNAGIDGSNNI